LALLSQRGQLLAGPFLEATAPYVFGENTLQGLVASGLLHEGFRQLFEMGDTTSKVAREENTRRGFGLRRSSPLATDNLPKRRERFPADRLLYRHQEQAIQRLCCDIAQHDLERNTVVTSGTGSGKTECFLIPALDWVLRHPTRSQDGRTVGRGLRVLLVYPMNALVNDQIRRLIHLVGCWRKRGDHFIPITFARYTSETQGTRREGLTHEPNAPDN